MIRSLLLPAGAMLLFSLGPAALSPSRGQEDGRRREPVVTSDTAEYCNTLLGRISGMMHRAPPPVEAAALSVEGERMCEHGQTRGGIMRLRRVIVILNHAGE